jgi:hypothetical protein
MSTKCIKIACEGKTVLPLAGLEEFQGNLAELSKESYRKLRNSLERFGICFPVYVWRAGGRYKILDGHARVKTLRLMEAEGYEIPPVPVVFVEAATEKDAKKILLAARSEYHKTTEEGLYEFLAEAQIDAEDIKDYADLSTVEIEKFIEGFGQEQEGEGGIVPDGEDGIKIIVTVPGSVWLGKRDEILDVVAKIEKTYLAKSKVEE